jgi:hypothetical protein
MKEGRPVHLMVLRKEGERERALGISISPSKAYSQ